MGSVRKAPQIVLSLGERAELEALASRRKTAQALAMRARIVLACAQGTQSKDIAVELGVGANTVSKWRRRFAALRLDGLHDEPRSGTPRTIDDVRIEARDCPNARKPTRQRHPLEFTRHGQGERAV